jgi:hypothetical protein
LILDVPRLAARSARHHQLGKSVFVVTLPPDLG